MSGYLRRLATTGAAYTAASIFSKLIAVALLPLYTRYLSPADYGAAEVLFAAVVSASIIVRLGVIEALLRFYYKEDEDPDRVVATSFAALFWFATVAALVALPFAEPISEALLGSTTRDRRPSRRPVRISIGGLWVLTLHEYLLTIFRLEERARAFFVTTMLNVVAAIGLTVVLVVGAEEGARGLLLGSYVSGADLRARPDRPPLAPPLALDRPRPAAPHAALRHADDAGRALALRTQLRRPDHHRAHRRPRRGRALLAGGQVRPGGQRPRARLPARLAAARLLDPRRRRGASHLRRRGHLVRRRLQLRRRRHVAALALDRARPGRARSSSTPTKRLA